MPLAVRPQLARPFARVAVVVGLVVLVALPGWPVAPAHADTGVVSEISTARQLAGLESVTLDPVSSVGALAHAVYLVAVGTLSHDQDPSHSDATDDGARAAASSLIDGTLTRIPTIEHVDRFLAAPFHAVELLHPSLTSVGWGFATSLLGRLAQVAVLDVRTNRDGPAAQDHVAWPGNGATTSRHQMATGEWPDPLTACPGLARPTGHPIYLRMPRLADVHATAVVHEGRRLSHCAITASSYTNPDPAAQDRGRDVLAANRSVVLIPSAPMASGAYTVTVDTSDAIVTWTFAVGDSDRAPTHAAPDVVPTSHAKLIADPGTTRNAVWTDEPAALAVGLSQRVVPTGAADHVVLCRSDVYADCLAASVAIGPRAPLLYAGNAGSSSVPPVTRAELERVLVPGGTIVVVGGPAAVSTPLARDLATTWRVERIQGDTRWDTAGLLADRFAPDASEFLIARGDDWADAVTAGALSAATGTPILLTRPAALPAATRDRLHDGDRVTIAGGEAAVGGAVAQGLAARTGSTPTRLAGATRAETAAAISRAWIQPGPMRLVADLWSPNGWQGALAAGPLAAAAGAPLLSAHPDAIPDATRDAFADLAPYGSATRVTTLAAGPAAQLESEVAGLARW